MLLPKVVQAILPWLPLVSVVGITLVVLAVVAGSAATILSVGLLVTLVVILHNGVGYGLGFLAAKAVGLDESARRAVAIEVGISVWHNVSGSLLASYSSRRPPKGSAPAIERELDDQPVAS